MSIKDANEIFLRECDSIYLFDDPQNVKFYLKHPNKQQLPFEWWQGGKEVVGETAGEANGLLCLNPTERIPSL